jgi:glutamine synthetase
LVYGVKQYPEVLRTSFASQQNDFRLGGHEAPPAILSVYTGPVLGEHLSKIAHEGGSLEGYEGGRYGGRELNMGAKALAPVGASLEDRNRTAPVPFCGNRFEFRAIGSNQHIGPAMTAVNTIVAEGLAVISERIEAGMSPRDAVAEVLKENENIIFNGNCYSSEWHTEAQEVRNLPNLPGTTDALAMFTQPRVSELFAKHNVYSEAETQAVANIMYERYVLDSQIEGNTMLEMIHQGVLPACAEDLKAYEGTGLAGPRQTVYAGLAAAADMLQATMDAWPEDDDVASAQYGRDVFIPAMRTVRESADAAEKLIHSEKYPFPTYTEMLFNHKAHGRSL